MRSLKPGATALIALGLLSLTLVACSENKQAKVPGQAQPAKTASEDQATAPLTDAADIKAGMDYHSYANMADYQVNNIDLDLDVDFSRKTLSGTATLEVEKLNKMLTPLVLDSRALTINKVEVDGHAVKYSLGDTDPHLGTPLSIDINDSSKVVIHYSTSPQASGLQWLNPAQTAGKQQPFLFSQAQAIHARSFIPLQDSPKARLTYSATIRTPKALRAVMSANNDPSSAKDGEYHFTMPQKIPAYLIAIAVGDLEFQAMGERTGVYAEPSVLAAAAKEFEDTEAMLLATEKVYGPYRWDRYDLLILPPSFPFGGMENPRLSFITPTVIAGDKSLTSLIAHELAHSWSGNLVTNASWRDLWLNEGFTTYLTNRIMQITYGDRRYKMEMALGYEDLQADLADKDARDQILAIDMRGRDPDEVFSNIPYEKGSLFLYEIEHKIGRANFDKFLREYFDHFAFKSISTEAFEAYIAEELLAKYPQQLDADRFAQWIHQPGLLADAPKPQSDAFDKVKAQRIAWLAGKLSTDSIKTANWSSHEWKTFLDGMPKQLSAKQLANLDAQFAFTQAGNNEVAHSWLMIAVRNQYQPAYPRLREFLVGIGRNKFLRPLYRALKESDQLALAQEIFEQAQAGYHPLSVKVNSKIVYPES